LPDAETKHLIIKRDDITIENKNLCKNIFGHYPQKPIRIGHVNKGGQGERIYHELGHAITLSAYGGGVGAKTGLYSINGKVRKLHPEECKRLMSFPENFKINKNPQQAYKQFGNAVVVKVVNNIFLKLMEDLKCQEEKKTQLSARSPRELLLG
jgi:DNA (cytosine-5)-methyltransferase 1